VDNDIQESIETWRFIIYTTKQRNAVKFIEKPREKDRVMSERKIKRERDIERDRERNR